jgi:hypothetical protein
VPSVCEREGEFPSVSADQDWSRWNSAPCVSVPVCQSVSRCASVMHLTVQTAAQRQAVQALPAVRLPPTQPAIAETQRQNTLATQQTQLAAYRTSVMQHNADVMFQGYKLTMDPLRDKFLPQILETLSDPLRRRSLAPDVVLKFQRLQAFLQVRTSVYLLLPCPPCCVILFDSTCSSSETACMCLRSGGMGVLVHG